MLDNIKMTEADGRSEWQVAFDQALEQMRGVTVEKIRCNGCLKMVDSVTKDDDRHCEACAKAWASFAEAHLGVRKDEAHDERADEWNKEAEKARQLWNDLA